MSNFNPTFYNRVAYIISCNAIGFTEKEILEPEGWNNDQKELARNKDYHGIFPKFSNSLKFVGDGADYINDVRSILDINAELKLTKYEKHPKTDRWIRTYWGYLDMSTWEKQDKKVSIKFNSGGLEQLIKARESDEVEIDRLDTIDGEPLEELQTNEVAFDGRRIFLKSKWKTNNDYNPLRIRVYSADGNTRYSATGFPLTLDVRSHEQAQSTIPSMGGPGNDGNTGRMILALFDRDRTVRVFAENLKFTPTVYFKNVDWAFFKVCLTLYEGGTNYQLKERRDIFHAGHLSTSLPNVFAITGQTFSLNFNETFNVAEGESIALEFYIGSDLGASEDFLVDFLDGFEGNVFCDEDSYFEPTKAEFVLVHDALDRFVKICSSYKRAFYSKYFGRTDLGYPSNGPGAFMGITHGFWIRGFKKLPLSTEDIPNLFKPLTTSLKDCIEAVSSVLNVGMGIEEINNVERVRVEPLSYFYNNNVTIKLPFQVKNVKRSVATEYYFSSLNLGYESGGDYEEAQGLDEPNGRSKFNTIARVKEVFEKISPFRADSYGKEFARRKPFSKYDTLDTSYDEEIWLLDLKKTITGVFTQRKWQDDFAEAPTGIFSPDTADSLRFSPFNILLRHGWMIASGLTKYPVDYVRYGSSTANSQLKTKLIGGNLYAENGNIINSELQRARFIPEWIEFEHKVDFNVSQQVFGTTVIQGEEIPNYYGTIEFLNENSEWEKGFLFNLKPNNKGQWKLLKANR